MYMANIVTTGIGNVVQTQFCLVAWSCNIDVNDREAVT